MNSVGVSLLTVAVALVVTACKNAEAGSSGCSGEGTELYIAVEADTTHEFNTGCLMGPAYQSFTIEFKNEDSSPHGNHNIDILKGKNHAFVGETVARGNQITYSVGALPPGTYEFRCDHHPFMKGWLIVR